MIFSNLNYTTNLRKTVKPFKEYHNKWKNLILSTRVYNNLRNA